MFATAVDDFYALNTLTVDEVVSTGADWDYLDTITNDLDLQGALNYPTDDADRSWHFDLRPPASAFSQGTKKGLRNPEVPQPHSIQRRQDAPNAWSSDPACDLAGSKA